LWIAFGLVVIGLFAIFPPSPSGTWEVPTSIWSLKQIDLPRLVVSWLGVVAFTGAACAFAALGKKAGPQQPTPPKP